MDSVHQTHPQPPLLFPSLKMYSPREHVPISYGPETRPVRRHHTPRYIVHRVQESLTTRVFKLICSIILSLLFLLGLITFILWLSLRPHRPRFHIREFSVPGLAQDNGFANAQMIFNVTARNSNQNIGIYYDTPFQVTVFYQDQSLGSMSLLHPFYQQPKNTTILSGTFGGSTLTVNNDRWIQFMADLGRGSVEFRLEITSTIHFKVSTWDIRRHKVHANCQIEVGPDGSLMETYRNGKCRLYFT